MVLLDAKTGIYIFIIFIHVHCYTIKFAPYRYISYCYHSEYELTILFYFIMVISAFIL